MREGIPVPESREVLKSIKSAFIFVPGLAENSTNVFVDLLKSLNEKSRDKESFGIFTVSTHPEKESSQKPLGANEIPITCMISDNEKTHSSLDDRTDLVKKSLETALDSGAEKITMVGHSAGGLATLKAVVNEIEKRSLDKNSLTPKINVILVSPVIPREANVIRTVAWELIKVVLSDFKNKIGQDSKSYLREILTRGEIDATDEALEYLLAPIGDKNLNEGIIEGKVPISGGEVLDLLTRPKLFTKDPKEMEIPKNIKISVIIPKEDRVINPKGLEKMVLRLKKLMGKQVTEYLVEGGHAPLGKKDEAFKLVERLMLEE